MDANEILNELQGSWTYRSYNNNPDPAQDDSWFVAELRLKREEERNLSGTLDSGNPAYVYNIDGRLKLNNDTNDYFIVELTGNGSTQETRGHVYKYVGALVPKWSEGVNQRPSFIGSVLRAKRPDDPTQEGKVGSFIASKRS